MQKKVFIFWSLFVGLALMRVFFSFTSEVPDVGECLRQSIQGIGEVTTDPERKDSGQIFIVAAQTIQTGRIKCPAGILIRLKTKLYPRFSFGDTVSFSGKLSAPFNFKSDSGRAFDYKGYLAKDDVYYEMKSAIVRLSTDSEQQKFKSSCLEKCEDEKHKGSTNFIGSISNRVSSILFSLKRHFVSNLESALGEPHAALASGLVVGEKAALGKDLLNDFRTVGLIHIVVLSGYNITVVGDAMRKLLSFLPRVWGISVSGIGIALFGILVGGGATVVRSCFMAGIALSADLIRRDYNVVRALALAALVMLIQNPMILLHDPSFQLSFLATLGLVLFASPIEKRIQFIPEKFGMRGIVASTIATQLTVSPYILYMMGQISIIGMVVNIIVLPFIPVTMLLIFLTGVTGFIWFPISHFFGIISHFLLSYELLIVRQFARIPFASVHLPIFSGWWVVGFYVVLAVVFVYVKKFSNKLTKKSDHAIFSDMFR